jgi:hypothetical protein
MEAFLKGGAKQIEIAASGELDVSTHFEHLKVENEVKRAYPLK